MNELSGAGVPVDPVVVPLPRKTPISSRALDHRPVTLTEHSFDATLSSATQPVVVAFWARWCNLSKSMAPYFTTTARKFRGRALFAKVETGEQDTLTGRCRIDCVPTVIVFRNGQELARHCGSMTELQLGLWLQPHLAAANQAGS